jgi:hypothetical protein
MKMNAIFVLSMLIVASRCLSTYHFTSGDQLLHTVQEKDGKTYVILFAKDDTDEKKLQITNARVAEGLYHNVLTTPPAEGSTADPTENDVVWARVNADDIDRNGHLMKRAKVDLSLLGEWPTVGVFKNGVGHLMNGATAVRHAKNHVVAFAEPAPASP